MNIEVEITRVGEIITIFPALTDLKGAVIALRALPRPPTVEERDPIDMPDRSQD
jgi:antitoxin VapB